MLESIQMRSTVEYQEMFFRSEDTGFRCDQDLSDLNISPASLLRAAELGDAISLQRQVTKAGAEKIVNGPGPFLHSKHQNQYKGPSVHTECCMNYFKRNRASEWPFEEITWSMVNNVKHDNHADRMPPIQRRVQRRLPTSSSETKHLYNA